MPRCLPKVCIHKVIPKCQSILFHRAKFSIIWLWNVPLLAKVVERGTYSDDCTCPVWAKAYFAVQDMKTTFHLPNSSLHNTSCISVCSVAKHFVSGLIGLFLLVGDVIASRANSTTSLIPSRFSLYLFINSQSSIVSKTISSRCSHFLILCE